MSWPRSYVPVLAGAALALAAAVSVPPAALAQQPATTAGGQAPGTMIVVLSASCAAQGSSTPASGSSCSAQQPVLSELQALGATVVSTSTLVDTITARMTPAAAQTIAAFPGVSQVIPDSSIPIAPTPPAQQLPTSPVAPGAPGWRSHSSGLLKDLARSSSPSSTPRRCRRSAPPERSPSASTGPG